MYNNTRRRLVLGVSCFENFFYLASEKNIITSPTQAPLSRKALFFKNRLREVDIPTKNQKVPWSDTDFRTQIPKPILFHRMGRSSHAWRFQFRSLHSLPPSQARGLHTCSRGMESVWKEVFARQRIGMLVLEKRISIRGC